MLALTDSGRPVSLAELANWRRDGLLPPLASHGLGTGKGKSYCWHQEGILAQAAAAYDLLKSLGRPDAVLWRLFLAGYPVPLPQLRRVWRHRGRLRKSLPFSPDRDSHEVPMALAVPDNADQLLLDMVLLLSAGIAPGSNREARTVVTAIDAALSRLSRAGRPVSASVHAERLWFLLTLLGTVPETGDLVAGASDAELREAQHYLSLAGGLLAADGAKDGAWPEALTDTLAPVVLVAVLVLLRQERRDILERIAQRVEGMGRQEHVPPARRHVALRARP